MEDKNAKFAKFIGWEYVNDDPEQFPNGYWVNSNENNFDLLYDGSSIENDGINGWFTSKLHFDSSWDWIMPVWQVLQDKVSDSGLDTWKEMHQQAWCKQLLEIAFPASDLILANECLFNGINWLSEIKNEK